VGLDELHTLSDEDMGALAVALHKTSQGNLLVTVVGAGLFPLYEAFNEPSDGGHGNLPVGGHRFSPLAATRSPHGWPRFLPTVLS
jgi:hypothetical protein